MSEVRLVPALTRRAETEPLAFGNDWPGVFIRGDDALGYATALRASKLENGIVNELIDLFEACRK